MMTADLAVLTTRLPFVDRGTLSRAWYDALHLAHPKTDVAPHFSWPAAACAGRIARIESGVTTPDARTLTEKLAGARIVGSRRTFAPVMHTRTLRPLRQAQKCREISRPVVPKIPGRTAAVVELPEGGRVCLIMHNDRGGLRVTALCTPALRARVAQALTQVQLMLAHQGVACNMQVSALPA
jgi:hypothetical protein